jgi:succinate dehydrogenase/fumarate reductase cytochrome b subunit
VGQRERALRARRSVQQPRVQLAPTGVAIVYVVANIALAFHLYHGAWSMFQSMGINNPRYNKLRRASRRVRRVHPASATSASRSRCSCTR